MDELSVEKQIDSCCDQYEVDLRSSRLPDISDYLKLVDGAHRERLLRELIALEVELLDTVAMLERAASHAEQMPEYAELISDCMGATQNIADETEGQAHSAHSQGAYDWQPTSKVGNYTLIKRIGEGGMGSVWLAEQLHPVRRRVALKIIRPGLGSGSVIARFEAERQALAMMDHPSIARILDAGATERGEPFFAMELVSGTSLTSYCDNHHCTLADRLHLFVQVCQAVQHAHQKGIIHRDLKPSNILVAEYDGEPIPKVIDFGLAKALEAEQKLTDKSLFTEYGQVLGTIRYMSPEQAGLDSLDIDTRTDIYALGVILYELLTGSTPLDDEFIKGKDLLTVLELIREQEAPRPSNRLTSSSEQRLKQVTEDRATEVKQLKQILAGDLDWVVMKSLDKDRSRRYETATTFADDVLRFLHSEPVEARPPSFSYRAAKFVRKNRGLVAAAVALTAMLILGAAGTTAGMFRAIDATKRANQAAKQAEDRAGELRRVVEFQERQLASVDPEVMGAQLKKRVQSGLDPATLAAMEELHINYTDVALEALLTNVFQPTLKAIGQDFQKDQRLQGRLLYATGSVMSQVGLIEAAVEPLQASAKLHEHGADSNLDAQLAAEASLATALRMLGKLDEAKAVVDSALEWIGDETVSPRVRASVICEKGMLALLRGRPKEAAPYLLDCLEIRRSNLGAKDLDTLLSMQNVAKLRLTEGSLAEAEALLQEAARHCEDSLGADARLTLVARSNLADCFYTAGKEAKAKNIYNETLVDCRRVLGNEHPLTLQVLNGLGMVHQNMGEYDAAETCLVEFHNTQQARFGDRHQETINAANNLSMLYWNQGRFADAEPLIRKVIADGMEVLGESHNVTLSALNSLGLLYMSRQQFEEAEQLFKRVLDIRTTAVGERDSFTLTSIANMGFLYHTWGKLEQAKPYHEKALRKRIEVLGVDHRDTLVSRNNLAQLHLDMGRLEEAAPMMREVMEESRRLLGNTDPQTLSAIRNCGLIENQQGNVNEAARLFEEVMRQRQAVLSVKHPDTRAAIGDYIFVLAKQHKYEPAATLAVDLMKAHEDEGNAPDAIFWMVQLADLQMKSVANSVDAEEWSEAVKLLETAVERAVSSLGAWNPNTLFYVSKLVDAYRREGRSSDAETLLEARWMLAQDGNVAAKEAALNTLMLFYRNERMHEKVLSLAAKARDISISPLARMALERSEAYSLFHQKKFSESLKKLKPSQESLGASGPGVWLLTHTEAMVLANQCAMNPQEPKDDKTTEFAKLLDQLAEQTAMLPPEVRVERIREIVDAGLDCGAVDGTALKAKWKDIREQWLAAPGAPRQ